VTALGRAVSLRLDGSKSERSELPMPICAFASEEIRPLSKTTFGLMQLQERHDLQRLLRANIAVVATDMPVIAEEFGDWDASRGRIDLLGIERDANLVVIALKRTEDGGQVTGGLHLQGLLPAAQGRAARHGAVPARPAAGDRRTSRRSA
jgi:hypothetical protein